VPGTRSLGQGLAVDVRFYWPPKAPVLHFADGLILVSLITTEMVVTACRISPGRDLAISEQFPHAKARCSPSRGTVAGAVGWVALVRKPS
jgi:hypothetical protein